MMVRGGAFSNAQTGNLALCALALGKGQWQEAAYYVIPIAAYLLGCLASELLTKSMKRKGFMRWETLLLLLEIVAAATVACRAVGVKAIWCVLLPLLILFTDLLRAEKKTKQEAAS